MGMTNGQWLQDRFDNAVMVGEEPYQANRAAVKDLDILDSPVDGAQDLKKLLSGIDEFIVALEEFGNVTEAVARRATSVVR